LYSIISWKFQSKLVAPDGAAGDNFGVAVSISKDHIIIGSCFSDENGSNSGSAYLYSSEGTFIEKLMAPDGAVFDRFGIVVSISNNNIIITSYSNNGIGPNSGSAYLYSSVGTFIQKITAPDGATNDHFGAALSISDNYLIIGAPVDDDSGSESGSAYLYSSGGTFIQKITAPDGAAGDYFGCAVSNSDTLIIIGSCFNNDNGSKSGSVYLYSSGGTFIQKITAPDGADYDEFGRTISISDDKIIIGAPYDDDNDIESGSAYLYSIGGTFIQKITAPDGAFAVYFGWALSISDNYLIIGALWDRDNGLNSGSAYLYSSGGTFIQKFLAPDGATGDEFGGIVSISNDKIIIGTNWMNWADDGSGTYSGSAYMFSV